MKWWRGNGEVVPAIVFGPTQLEIETQERLTRLTGPASPQCQGTDMYRFQGDAGYDVNAFGGELPHAMQGFRGAATPIAHPESAQLGYMAGVDSASSLPYTTLPDIDGSLATMSGVVY